MTAMSGLTVESLQEDELDAFVRVQWDAFEPLEVDMIMPMIYPAGLQPDLIERLRARVLRETDGEVGKFCFTAKDSTGQILATSWWAIVESPPKTPDEIAATFEKAAQTRIRESPPEGMNSALYEAFLKAAIYSEYETMQGRSYVSLRVLATNPAHQRKGAGSLLLKHGLCKFSDQLHLPTYLDAGINGKPLYERFGFEVTSTFPFDGRNYGGRSEGKHWCMVRPAVR
jgi:GNAT superfamily N-acetyltransferase